MLRHSFVMKLTGIAEFLEKFMCFDVFTFVYAYTKSLQGVESFSRS
jgi:hypothetical protein